jgi:hypothetical protein
MKKRKPIKISNLGGVLISVFVCLVSITALVFASYTGPNRSYSWYTTSYERKQCHYTGIKDYPGKGYCACSYTTYVSTNNGCPGINTGLFTASACGWSGICATYGLTGTSSSSSTVSCSASDTGATAVQTQHNGNHPAATVSGSASCTTTGSNGWCVSPEKVTISGSEPLSGYSITGIEGTQNGTNFTCSGDSCDVSLVEGANAFTYWAVSSYGDTSLQGNTSANQDTQKPQVTITVGGTAGKNGWYTSGQVTGSADDPVPGSGINSITYSLDSAANTTYTSPLTLAAGTHTVSMTASDKAGWTDTKFQAVNVDLADPTITYSVSGTAGNNSWYTTDATLTSSATDPTPGSGLNTFTISDNRNPFSAFSGSTLFSDGPHVVTLRAEDIAGRITTDEKTINVDTQKPQMVVAINGTAGENGWYTSASMVGSALDPTPGSGINSIIYSLDSAANTAYSSALTLTAGTHTVSMTATDKAGWTDSDTKTANVDLDDPTITSSVTGTSGGNSWYTTDVTLAGSATDPTPGSGLDSFTISDNGNPFTAFSGSTVLSDGQHEVTLRAEDNAGRVTTNEKTIKVDTQKPTITKSITGTTGTNGWYINATLNASSSDPTPGSGIDTFVYSLDGSPWAAYSTPLVMTDGLHTVDLRTADLAGWTDETSQDIKVDSVKPSLSVDITGTTSDKNTYTSDAVISASGADLTSGLARIEYNDNAGGWTTYTKPISFVIGEHTVLLRSVDNAGNLSEDTSLKFTVIKNGPYIEMPSKWSIYESPKAIVNAGYVVLAGAKVTISDPQNRYPAVVRNYSFSGSAYTISLAWDRKFANGKSAPIGTVNVNIDAWDVLGLHASASGIIEIELDPTATPTLTITPTPSATPVQTEGVPLTSGSTEITLTATAIPQVVSTETPKPFKGKANETTQALGFGILLGFVAMIGITISLDPRPKAWNQLDEQVNIYIQLEDKKKEK